MAEYWQGEGYGSHREALKWCIDNSNGPILELGGGIYSTPLTHEAAKNGRKVLTIDHNPEWVKSLSEQYSHPNHTIKVCVPHAWEQHLPDWNMVPYQHEHWGVVFVDQMPSSARILGIVACAFNADFVVVHDTEQPLYYYDNAMRLFKNVREHRLYPSAPNTGIGSNFREIDFGDPYWPRA